MSVTQRYNAKHEYMRQMHFANSARKARCVCVCVCMKQCRVGSGDHVAELADGEADDR